MHGGVVSEFAEERAELVAVLESAYFKKAPNQARLLTYLCERQFTGLTDQPKEYQIAIEAFGRGPDFNTRADSIVRVEAYRLRKRLTKYYESDGASHRVRMLLDPGKYSVRFSYAEAFGPAPGDPVDAGSAPADGNTVAPAQRTFRPGVRWALLGAGILIVAGTVFWLWPGRDAARARMSGAAPQAWPEDAAATASGRAVRILAGYDRQSHIDLLGRVWHGDAWYQGGMAGRAPRQALGRTPDPTLYRQYRSGTFEYAIPLPSGVYELHLYFGPSLQPWSVSSEPTGHYPLMVGINGAWQVLDLDFRPDGTDLAVPDVRSFRNISPGRDGRLRLSFQSAGQIAYVNAIEILPGARNHVHPIRITTRGYFYTDNAGRLWLPDQFYRGGTVIEYREDVQGGPDPGLFACERYGNFDYLIQVAPGTYGITIGFAEMWFGPKMPGQGGAGSRRFDIVCNGRTLAKDLDVFREAGGAERALVRTFHGVTTDAAGRLRLNFAPTRNNATFSFLEIDDEPAPGARKS